MDVIIYRNLFHNCGMNPEQALDLISAHADAQKARKTGLYEN